MPIVEGRADVLKYLDWDTYDAKGGEEQAQSIKLFSQPMGMNKRFIKTSMYQSNQFPRPVHKNVTHLQIAFGAFNNYKDMKMFRTHCRYELWIGNKSYDKGPMSRFQYWDNTSEELQSIIELAKLNDLKFVGNQIDYRIGDNIIGHHIMIDQTFSFELIFDNIKWVPKDDFQMVVMLNGVTSRGVQ